jgi:very-short-patch-repair endonuclease
MIWFVNWGSLARRQSGVITRSQLNSHGLSDTGVARLLATEQVSGLADGVYLVRGAPLTHRARLWAAALSTDGVVGFATAAELWGFTDIRDARVHVVLPHSRRVYPPRWVRVHRVPLPHREVTQIDELPVTSTTWTLCDYLPSVSHAASVQLADRALQRGWLTAEDVDRRLRDHPGRHGNRRLRALLALTSDGAAAESERRLQRLLRAAGIHDWRPNYRIWIGGDLIVIDIALPGARIAIEVDGMAYHVDAERFQRDRTRQNLLVGAGWTVLRFTWSDLVDRPSSVIAAIQRARAA